MRSFLLFLLLTGVLTVSAEDQPVRFRLGTLVPKFTQDKPETETGSAAASKSSPAWAVLNVTLDEGRGLNILDYALEQNGTTYPCVGIAEGGKPFGKLENVDKNAGERNYRLLFAVPSKDSEYGLKFQLIPGQDWKIRLNTPPPPPPPKPVEAPKPAEDAKPSDEMKPAEAPEPVKAPEPPKPTPPPAAKKPAPAPKKSEPPAVAKKAVSPINKAIAKQAASVKAPVKTAAPAKAATPAKAAPAKTAPAKAAPAKTTTQKDAAKKDKKKDKKDKKKKKIIRK